MLTDCSALVQAQLVPAPYQVLVAELAPLEVDMVVDLLPAEDLLVGLVLLHATSVEDQIILLATVRLKL